jgi:hypothetical protein
VTEAHPDVQRASCRFVSTLLEIAVTVHPLKFRDCLCVCLLCLQVAARDGHVGCADALQALQAGDDELLRWVEYQMFTPAYTRCVERWNTASQSTNLCLTLKQTCECTDMVSASELVSAMLCSSISIMADCAGSTYSGSYRLCSECHMPLVNKSLRGDIDLQ